MRYSNKILALVATAIIVAFLLPGVGFASKLAQSEVPQIQLLAATFTPANGEQPNIPENLKITGYVAEQRGYYLVQFQGPIEQFWKDEVTQLGGEILDYIPDFAFKVRMTPAQAKSVDQLQSVIWVGFFHPAYKLSPELNVADGAHLYTISVEDSANIQETTGKIAQLGVNVLSSSGSVLTILADSAQIESIAHVLDVAWIENFAVMEKMNEYGGGVIMGANAAIANGYDGSTQIIAIADTGLGGGDPVDFYNAHVDIPADRIVAINNWPAEDGFGCWDAHPNGPIDVDSGHGTHVAVSAVGDGSFMGQGRGTAPGARLIFQAVEDYIDFIGDCETEAAEVGISDGYFLFGLPEDPRLLFQQAYDAGARIHSNSWGDASCPGCYATGSQNADDFIWSHRDLLVVFAAGNEGTDANENGIVDENSINIPATAKNVLTIGGTENDRQGHWECDLSMDSSSHPTEYPTCPELDGMNIVHTMAWGEIITDDFQTEPLFSDPYTGNAEQMALFSSRGPTDDGRIKPDVVAPGAFVLSGYSDLYQNEYDLHTNPETGQWQWDGEGNPFNRFYKYMSGTSMSVPLASGGAAVVRDFYNKKYGFDASAALVKATIINSAVDLLDENNDGANDNDYPIPNFHEGWGRVDLANATDGSHQYVDEASGLNTSGRLSFAYEVRTGGNPFKVTLVWSDYWGSTSARRSLVNDLDLLVTAPDGTTYRGNVFSGGWSQTAGSYDRLNNVENVYVQSAAAGVWTVRVNGYNVPHGRQPFALVVDGSFELTGEFTYCGDAAFVIPSSGGTSDSISIGESGNIVDVNVYLDVSHSQVGLLTFDLKSPDGGSETLIDRPGYPASGEGCEGDDINAKYLDDEASLDVEDQCAASAPAVGGAFLPSGNLSSFEGKSAEGEWTLTVNNKGSAGSVNQWCLVVTYGRETLPPPTPTPVGNLVYLSSTTGGSVGGVSFQDEDILVYNRDTGGWAMHFDGSDVGISGSEDIDAFTILPDGTILMSFASPGGRVTGSSRFIWPSDIIRFYPTSLGSTTRGTFELYFDGEAAETGNVDAIYVTSDGELIISTDVSANLSIQVPEFPGYIARFVAYLDGSDIDLDGLTAAWIDPETNDIYLTAPNDYMVGGIRGDGNDISIFHPTILGDVTSGTFGPGIFFDGDAVGFGAEEIDGLFIGQ